MFYDSLIIRCRCSNWSFLFYFLFFRYQNLETFIIDVNLVFDNCEKFNEDNSDIGRAGHNMRKFFEKRWTELLKQTNWGGLGPPRAIISKLPPGLKSRGVAALSSTQSLQDQPIPHQHPKRHKTAGVFVQYHFLLEKRNRTEISTIRAV